MRIRAGARRLRRALLAILLLLTPAGTGSAEQLGISPIMLELSPEAPGGVITLDRQAVGEQPMQVRVFAWSQSEGRDVLTPATDLQASPPFFTFPGSGRQIVRVVHLAPASLAEERAYRLVINQLPTERPDPADAAQIRFPLEILLPVFVSPDGRGAASGERLDWSAERDGGRLLVHVLNPHDARVRLSHLQIRQGGRTVGEIAQLAGYVLAGQTRVFEVPGQASAGPAEFAVTVDGHGPLSGALTIR